MKVSPVLSRYHATKPTVPVTAVAALIALSAIAMAGEQPVTRSRNVSLAGLDLSTTAGMSAARERAHDAARLLCTRLADRDDLSRDLNYVACVNDAMTQVMPRILEVARLNTPVNVAGNQSK